MQYGIGARVLDEAVPMPEAALLVEAKAALLAQLPQRVRIHHRRILAMLRRDLRERPQFPWSCGTVTATVPVELLFEASVQVTATLYTRSPLPERSARRLAVILPVIWESAALPSLLLTETMRHELATFASHAFATDTPRETATILWFGGQRTFGDAVIREMPGGIRSTTVTVAPQLLRAENASSWSCAVRVTFVTPSGYGPAGVCTSVKP